MRNKYILLRHGETRYQAMGCDDIYTKEEYFNIPLTDNGKEQIRVAAEKIKDKGVDLIYSSDLFRTRQVSEIVSKILGLEVEFDKRLRDTDFGEFSGKTGEEYRNFFSSRIQAFSKRTPGGENWRDVKKRVVSLINDIEKKNNGKIILIISHADPLWILAGYLKGLTEAELLKNREEGRLFLDVGQFIEI